MSPSSFQSTTPRCSDAQREAVPTRPLARELDFETVAWQTGTRYGMATFSRLHVMDARGWILCGAKPNMHIGNFGHNHTGRCRLCWGQVERRGIPVEGDEHGNA
jgi:hypothetical protein